MNEVSECMGMHEDVKTPLEENISSHFMEKSKRNHQKRVLKSQWHKRFLHLNPKTGYSLLQATKYKAIQNNP